MFCLRFIVLVFWVPQPVFLSGSVNKVYLRFYYLHLSFVLIWSKALVGSTLVYKQCLKQGVFESALEQSGWGSSLRCWVRCNLGFFFWEKSKTIKLILSAYTLQFWKLKRSSQVLSIDGCLRRWSSMRLVFGVMSRISCQYFA